jgi:hypothetical protein
MEVENKKNYQEDSGYTVLLSTTFMTTVPLHSLCLVPCRALATPSLGKATNALLVPTLLGRKTIPVT